MADANAPQGNPFNTLQLIRHRAVEAVLGQTAINHIGLSADLRRRLSSLDVSEGALVREPAIEGAAPFLTGGKTFADLSGSLLHPDVIAAISAGPDDRPYRFPPDAKPYLHQIKSWELLTNPTPQSVLVSSGTGSGKTECFLMPLLHDLANEAEQSGRLSGVRALALYPLNALIASQQERLRAWTSPFNGKIRFGLYNGLTPETVQESEQRQFKEQVLGRDTLRKDPPPILVTNVTMLEYMSIRKVDRPLLENSKGKLRWIILDEAHSYVGSAAAEIALLLRRALLAFGVRPNDVRFVATSATIGEGKEVTDELRRFLRDVSGTSDEKVHVVVGERVKLDLPAPGPSQPLSDADLENRDAVTCSPAIQAVLRELEKSPMNWAEVTSALRAVERPTEAVLGAIANDTQGEPILPLRIHNYIRAVPGIWSCINEGCSGHRPSEWKFGQTFTERVEKCTACEAPVLEIIVCTECGEPYLDAVEKAAQLVQAATLIEEDEFAAASDRELPEDEDSESDDETSAIDAHWQYLVAARSLSKGRIRSVEPKTGRVADRPNEETVPFQVIERSASGDFCGACGTDTSASQVKKSLFRPIRFGAPFLIGNATPLLIEGVPPRPVDVGDTHRPPADGRQLISFTDSRQGTARFAASIQTNSERSFVRSVLYHEVQKTLTPAADSADKIADLEGQLPALEQAAKGMPALADLYQQKLAELHELQSPSGKGISWNKAREAVATNDQSGFWMRKVWKNRDERFLNSEEAFAEFLLLRELDRRPRRGNSLETMGLARLRFDAIDNISPARVPEPLSSRGRDVEEWKQFVYCLIDTVVRNNFATKMADGDVHWLIRKGGRKVLLPAGEQPQSQSERPWPRGSSKFAFRSPPVRILEKTLGLDRTKPDECQAIDEILAAAWNAILPIMSQKGAGYVLDLSLAKIAPITNAWICPVTRRLLSSLAFGKTPYGHHQLSILALDLPVPVTMPRLPITYPRDGEAKQAITDWISSDPTVAGLRAKGVWSNLQDRIAMMSPYLRAAEHSAQQPAGRLRRFEDEFKRGEINVLNCSTTMEMGVDIGSVSSVMMTNVPPSIANYRQRVGRAGRRRQGFASSLTYTRDTPLERETFRNPVLYLKRAINAPLVKLDSRRIVQRHVNALLLANWFSQAGGELSKTKVGEFFGCGPVLGQPWRENRAAAECAAWMVTPSTKQFMALHVEELVRNTALQGDPSIFEACAAALEEVERAFVAEWTAIQAQAAQMDKDAAANSLKFQLIRMCNENLLKELAIRSVLPGHGFPTAVVPFVNKDQPGKDEVDSDDAAPAKRRSYPSRNLDVAIRDYAPGAEVVVDGLVYTSAGVMLNWLRPAGDSDVPEIQSIKRYWECAECGAADCGNAPPENCPACHSVLGMPKRYLEPSGFTVDTARKPHADTDDVIYIEPEPERVIARGAGWESFLKPQLGRMRRSSDGLVFFSSAGGPSANGYALCLECGRAQAEDEAGNNPLIGHTPLRFTRRTDDGVCPGNGKSFAIQRNLSLGHDIVTDVAEIQPANLSNPGGAWALASALREALARKLGIEASEMGMAAEARRSALQQSTHSIFLYDKDSGGAGFSPNVVDLFDELLPEARRILDCKIDGCVTGCSSCILTPDLHRRQLIVDRKAALSLVDSLLEEQSAPSPEDAAVPEAVLSKNVGDKLVRLLSVVGGEVTIYANHAFDLATLNEQPLQSVFSMAQARGAHVQLVLDKSVFDGLDAAQKLGLRDIATRWAIALRIGPGRQFGNGASLIATHSRGDAVNAWISRDPLASTFGSHWGQGIEAPVVSARISEDVPCEEIPDASLLPSADTAYIEVTNELDRPISLFGLGFAKLLKPELERLGAWKPGQLTGLSYSDRYLRSPLQARLALEALASVRDELTGKAKKIPLLISTWDLGKSDARQPYRILHDWQWEEDRQDVFQGLAEAKSFALTFETTNAPHSRQIVLDFSGQLVRVVLDQGFGYWKAPHQTSFQFGANPSVQARSLLDAQFFVSGPASTYIVIKR